MLYLNTSYKNGIVTIINLDTLRVMVEFLGEGDWAGNLLYVLRTRLKFVFVDISSYIIQSIR